MDPLGLLPVILRSSKPRTRPTSTNGLPGPLESIRVAVRLAVK